MSSLSITTTDGLRTIFLVSQHFHIDAIARLHRGELDVRLVVSRPRLLRHAAEAFPGALAYDVTRARAGNWPNTDERPFAGIRDEVLRDLAPYEADVKAMIDRMNWTGASLAAMHGIYLRQAEIWDHYLREIAPEAVVFHGEPHRAFDWVLYGLCRSRHIPTAIISYTQLEDRLLLTESIEELVGPDPDVVARRAASHEVTHIDVARPKEVDVEGHDRDISAAPSYYMRTTIAIERDTVPLRRSLQLRGVLAPGAVVSRAVQLFRPYPAEYPNVVPDAPVTYARRRIENLRVRRLISRSIGIYEAAARPPDLDQPYVYYPLHMQPEATTLPMGGPLHDQLNNLRLLVSALPPRWRVLVKEHPQMLRFNKEWTRARGTVFYETLRDLDNVDLVPIDDDSSELSRNARLVATTTGTAGWEALLKGRFVLVFGYPWYATCPGVRRVGSSASCREAIEIASERGFVNDKAQVQAWIDEFTATCTVPGGWDDAEVDDSIRSRNELLNGLADGLMRWLRERGVVRTVHAS